MAIVRGYSWTTIQITWRDRRTCVAKLKIQEMGSRFLFSLYPEPRDYKKLPALNRKCYVRRRQSAAGRVPLDQEAPFSRSRSSG